MTNHGQAVNIIPSENYVFVGKIIHYYYFDLLGAVGGPMHCWQGPVSQGNIASSLPQHRVGK